MPPGIVESPQLVEDLLADLEGELVEEGRCCLELRRCGHVGPELSHAGSGIRAFAAERSVVKKTDWPHGPKTKLMCVSGLGGGRKKVYESDGELYTISCDCPGELNEKPFVGVGSQGAEVMMDE